MYFFWLVFYLLLIKSVQQHVDFSLDDSSYENNDLNQFKRYVSLTNFLNEKSMFDLWTDCQNKLSQSYARNWRCIDAQTSSIAKMNGTFTWNRHTIDEGGKGAKLLVPDCAYNVTETYHLDNNAAFTFQIHQYNCEFQNLNALGGSSFQVIAHSGHSIAYCKVLDLFNNSYYVKCPNVECEARKILSRNPKSAYRLSKDPYHARTCLNITIILDYEHFDAFSETKSSEPPMRHFLTNFTRFCKPNNSSCHHTEHFWMHNYGTHDLSDYEYISKSTYDGSFPQLPTVKTCFDNEKITFVIDGQLNMVSHYLEELYIDSNPRGSFRFENKDKNFVLDTADFFGTDIVPLCEKDQGEHTFIFEFGNFDLRVTPPRNLIKNPLTLASILEKIRQISSNPKCSNVKLLWVNMPPVHKCIHHIQACTHEVDSGWSNNYASSAVNQYFASAVQNLSIPTSRFEIIDRYEILYPRLMSETYACDSLFVCRKDKENTVQTTSSFRALVSQIVRTACDIPQVNWTDAYSHSDKFYEVKKNESSFYFYTMKGIRRRIPDVETLDFLQQQTDQSDNNTILVDQDELSIIPVDPSINAYTSRQEGMLICSEINHDEIFMMDGGNRRPLAQNLLDDHSETLYHILGRDHANVNKILIGDINIIPIGDPITKISDLANVTAYEDARRATDIEKMKIMKIAANRTYATLIPCLQNGALWPKGRNIEYPHDAEGHYYDLLERTSIFRNQPMHYYAGYEGPWIENYFIDTFIDKPLSYFNGMIPLFIQWVDIMVAANDFDKIVKLLREILRPDVLYLAVSQSDKGLEDVQRHHPNILTISAGGWGHIPIPLIKGEVPYKPLPDKFAYDTVFFGNVNQHSRPEALEHMRKMFPKYNVKFEFGTYAKDWDEKLRTTRFPLAPRGFGRSSFRFSEIIQTGRAPIYVYDDDAWLPYQGTNSSIEKYGMSVSNRDNMKGLAQFLSNMTDAKYREISEIVYKMREDFTYRGVIKNIDLFIKDPLGPNGGLLKCNAVPKKDHR